MNKVILIGRLANDPELRSTAGGTSVASYRLAVDRRGKEKEADFLNCVAFGKSGEFAAQYFHKGMKVAVEGRIQTGSYEKNGEKRYTTDIIVENQEFCEKKGADETMSGFEPMPTGGVEVTDDLPF